MARTCGLCQMALREGEDFVHARVGGEGKDPAFQAAVKRREEVRPGLYAACPDCAGHVRPHAAERLHAVRVKLERIKALTEDREFAEPVKLQAHELGGNDLL